MNGIRSHRPSPRLMTSRLPGLRAGIHAWMSMAHVVWIPHDVREEGIRGHRPFPIRSRFFKILGVTKRRGHCSFLNKPSPLALIAWLLLLIIATAGSSHAQIETSFNGYAKNLGIQSSSILTTESYYLNISRLRTVGRLDAGAMIYAELWLDTELITGSFLDSPDFQLSQGIERATLLDLDWTLSTNGNHQLRQSFFRANMAYYHDDIQLTFGRQRIAWGTGFIWNPTDILTPLNPTSIERDERSGIDALYAVVPFGALSQIEGVWAIGREPSLSSYAARYSFNVGDYDIAFTGGYFREDWILGGDIAGYLGGAGLRAEWAVQIPDEGPAQLRSTVNADYNFSSGYYTVLELHYNGPGSNSPSNYDFSSLLSGTTFNLAELYSAVILSKSLSPLTAVSMYSLLNINDGSGLAGPSLSWSALQNLELSVSSYLFFGKSNSEFGAFKNAYFGAVQFYF